MVALMICERAYRNRAAMGASRDNSLVYPFRTWATLHLAESGAGVIAGIALAAMPLQSALLTEQPLVADAHATSP